jgi:hypothetical protein
MPDQIDVWLDATDPLPAGGRSSNSNRTKTTDMSTDGRTWEENRIEGGLGAITGPGSDDLYNDDGTIRTGAGTVGGTYEVNEDGSTTDTSPNVGPDHPADVRERATEAFQSSGMLPGANQSGGLSGAVIAGVLGLVALVVAVMGGS